LKTSKIALPTFTSDDICAIIKECGKSGVREFNFNGLKISYGPATVAPAIEPVRVPYEIQEQTDSQAREAIERREVQLKDELLDSLIVEDPEGYEQLLKDGELVDEQTEE